MPVVLTVTLRAVASDVGGGSCRYLRLYSGVAFAFSPGLWVTCASA